MTFKNLPVGIVTDLHWKCQLFLNPRPSMMDRQQARNVSEIWGFHGFNGTIFQVSKYMVLGWIETFGWNFEVLFFSTGRLKPSWIVFFLIQTQNPWFQGSSGREASQQTQKRCESLNDSNWMQPGLVGHKPLGFLLNPPSKTRGQRRGQGSRSKNGGLGRKFGAKMPRNFGF